MDRELTPQEERVINFLKMFEKACDERRFVISVHASADAAEVIQKLEEKYKIVKTLRVDYVPSKGIFAISFTLSEFDRYLDYVLKLAGLKLKIDGSLETQDNHLISNEYLDG